MAARSETLLGCIRHLAAQAGPDEASDAALLGRYLADRDDRAFAALVDRHAELVLQVCLRVLGDSHDAEDAFKRMCRDEGLGCLADAAEAARGHTLLLMPVGQEQKTQLAALEKFFRLFAEPKCNALPRRNRHSRIDLEAPLTEVLGSIRPRPRFPEPGPAEDRPSE